MVDLVKNAPFSQGTRTSSSLFIVAGSPVLLRHRPLCLSALHHRDMAHRRGAGRSMPVPGASRDEDHITLGDGLFLGFSSNDPLALNDVQHLVLLVNMGPGPCARAE